MKLRLKVLPVGVVEELEVDDDGRQQVEDGEVGQEVADDFLVRGLSAQLELRDGIQLGLDIFENFSGDNFRMKLFFLWPLTLRTNKLECFPFTIVSSLV